MTLSWQSDKTWSDKFITKIKRIIGEYFITEIRDEDIFHNTDLIVFKLEPIRIACRVRRFSYYLKYRNEFTIRKTRPSGNKSELAKIIEGYGDYLFYGFSNKNEDDLIQWFLGDLSVFRLWFMKQSIKNNGVLPGIERINYDGSSVFQVFITNELPDNFIVAGFNLNKLNTVKNCNTLSYK